METTRKSAFSPRQIHWHAELVVTDMFWCDLLNEHCFFAEMPQTNSFVLDYLANVKQQLRCVFDAQRVYVLCQREKVRFNVRYHPRYNRLTKKTKFHFLMGKKQKKISISVDLNAYFPSTLSHPKIIIESNFITLIANEKNYLTMSIHDFLSTIDINIGGESEVVAVECTCSPYWQPTGKFMRFQQELSRFSSEGKDLLVYINDFNLDLKIKTLHLAVSDGVVSHVNNPSDNLFLMLARSLALYFLDGEEVSSIVVKNARDNLLRFLQRNQISWIKITHAYDKEGEYTRLNSIVVPGSSNHTFTVVREDNALMVRRSALFT